MPGEPEKTGTAASAQCFPSPPFFWDGAAAVSLFSASLLLPFPCFFFLACLVCLLLSLSLYLDGGILHAKLLAAWLRGFLGKSGFSSIKGVSGPKAGEGPGTPKGPFSVRTPY